MRKSLIIAVLLAGAVQAQQGVQVSAFSFSNGVHPTLSFQFEGTDARYVESWWKDELKRISKDVSNKKEVVAAFALLPQVSPDTVRVMMKADQRKGMPFVVAHVAILTTQGWVGPDSEARAFDAAKAYVQDQSTLLRRQLAQQEVTAAEKALSRLNTELSNLKREKERAEAGIEKSKQREAEAVQDQESLAKEHEELSAKAEAQRKENAAEASADGEKLLADQMKQLARLQDKRRKAGEDELHQRKKAEELAGDVKKSLEDQERKSTEIARQEQLVNQLRKKLAAIR